MNRASRSNLVADITLDVEFQVKKPYLLFRDKSHPELGTTGLYFPDDVGRPAIAAAVKKILLDLVKLREQGLYAAPSPAPAAAAAPEASDAGKALLTMLKASAPAPAPAATSTTSNGSTTTSAPGYSPAAAVLFQSARSKQSPAPQLAAQPAQVQPQASLNALLGIGSARQASAAAPAPVEPVTAPPALQASSSGSASSGANLLATLGLRPSAQPLSAPIAPAATPTPVASAPAPAPVAQVAVPTPAPVLAAPQPATSPSSSTSIAASLLGSMATAAAAAASSPAPASSHHVTSAGGGLGELNIILTRKQLQAVLMDMLSDDDFVKRLHAKYVETAMRMAEQ